MGIRWVELVTGSLEQKKQYRQYKARIAALSDSYRQTVRALERYITYFGGISSGEVLLKMLDDLAGLFEESEAAGTDVRAVVGDDPVEFAETFLANYSEGQWIDKERVRLRAAVDRAAGGSDDH